MEFLICIGALVLLMFVAYRGFSVIMFAASRCWPWRPGGSAASWSLSPRSQAS